MTGTVEVCDKVLHHPTMDIDGIVSFHLLGLSQSSFKLWVVFDRALPQSGKFSDITKLQCLRFRDVPPLTIVENDRPNSEMAVQGWIEFSYGNRPKAQCLIVPKTIRSMSAWRYDKFASSHFFEIVGQR